MSQSADLIVLTINTLEVAPAEKDITNTSWSANRWFFSTMQTNAAYVKTCISITISKGIFNTVCMTVSWTKTTIFKHDKILFTEKIVKYLYKNNYC